VNLYSAYRLRKPLVHCAH